MKRNYAELFVVSVLILYLELMLIRWIGTEIRIFAYLGNLILVICFFGVGFGCYASRQPVSLAKLALNLFLVALIVANPFRVDLLNFKALTGVLGGFQDYNIWQVGLQPQLLYVFGGFLMLAGLLALIFYVFVPSGQLLGRCFANHPDPIRAYSVNIGGSLAGVWLFHALSLASLSPPWWFGIAAALLLTVVMLQDRREWIAVLPAIATVAVIAFGGENSWRMVWSPYQKLVVTPHFIKEAGAKIPDGFELKVNEAGFQLMLNLSEPFLKANAPVLNEEEAQRSYYNLPFAFKSHIRRMLIVGAGTGNNAAAALRHGVEQVDCVEIDPQIYALGKELHPEQPYASPRVRMVVDDARAFLKRSSDRYDAIWFALLDSHTLGSTLNNLRLDHYVYTEESFAEAHRLLAEDGVLIMNFDAPRRWLADRLFGMLRKEFHYPPLAFAENHSDKYGVGSGASLICANVPIGLDQVTNPKLREYLRDSILPLDGNKRPTTDDWPYLYLEQARIPKLHLVTSLAIVGVVLTARKRAFGLAQLDRHFFALGAAFLLLEVQAVSRATLLFGMTWIVNAIVISAVLVMILAANLVAARWPAVPQWIVVTGLAVTIIALALLPLDCFNALRGAAKIIAAGTFLAAPMFFAGLIFIRSFVACEDKSHALGSNLIGALVGGLLESVSFMTGIRALVLLAGLFYVIALRCRRASR